MAAKSSRQIMPDSAAPVHRYIAIRTRFFGVPAERRRDARPAQVRRPGRWLYLAENLKIVVCA
jgi:hypothetical protein